MAQYTGQQLFQRTSNETVIGEEEDASYVMAEDMVWLLDTSHNLSETTKKGSVSCFRCQNTALLEIIRIIQQQQQRSATHTSPIQNVLRFPVYSILAFPIETQGCGGQERLRVSSGPSAETPRAPLARCAICTTRTAAARKRRRGGCHCVGCGVGLVATAVHACIHPGREVLSEAGPSVVGGTLSFGEAAAADRIGTLRDHSDPEQGRLVVGPDLQGGFRVFPLEDAGSVYITDEAALVWLPQLVAQGRVVVGDGPVHGEQALLAGQDGASGAGVLDDGGAHLLIQFDLEELLGLSVDHLAVLKALAPTLVIRADESLGLGQSSRKIHGAAGVQDASRAGTATASQPELDPARLPAKSTVAAAMGASWGGMILQ
ncbi:hypothetical protein PG997_014903 [Apiospora hydei]|uniref:Uncharacterized protein n=1 Tax=Apiospora hydei TaxID=1337664 RepID=A0ABR1UV51_9PEZI